MITTTYQWTIERYHQAIEAGIFDREFVELLEGEIIVMSPERETHAYYNTAVADELRRLLGDRVQIRDAKPIIIPNNSEPIPDITIAKPLGLVYLEHHPYPEDIFCLIEFANTTLTKDLSCSASKRHHQESQKPGSASILLARDTSFKCVLA